MPSWTQFLLFATATFTVHSDAFALQERTATTSSPKVVQHDIVRRQITDPLRHDRLRRRQGKTINAALDNQETLYFANVTIGTPAQSVRLHIDTGSSDLWVNVPTSRICTYRNQGYCDYAGTFNPNTSSTYKYANSLFTITYADGSGASGDYVTDNVVIGGATLQSQQFAIGYQSSSQEGILGIGYAANEAIVSTGGRTYPNVPVKMLQQGLINTNAYSLWLNDLDANTGSILFGGVNTDKYIGKLSTLPVIKSQGVYSAFYIALTALGMDGKVGSIGNNINTAVLLDSGSSLTYLPDNLASAVFSQLSVTYDTSQGAAVIDCSRANESRNLTFTFSGVSIGVDMSELVLPIGTSRGKPVCIVGIAPTGGSTPVLGDTFLRSAYVVYDLTSNQIALARTNFNSTTDNIIEITNGTTTSNAIPDSTVVASAVSSVPTSVTGGSRNGGLSSVSSSAGVAPTAVPSRLLHSVGAAGVVVAGVFFAL